MRVPRNPQAKILNHATGLGTVTAEMVRQRAIELALIAGRDGQKPTGADWDQANRELHGGHDDAGEQNEAEIVAESGTPATSVGHHVQNLTEDGELTPGEELFAEGMDEAEHDQMLADRMEHREERED